MSTIGGASISVQEKYFGSNSFEYASRISGDPIMSWWLNKSNIKPKRNCAEQSEDFIKMMTIATEGSDCGKVQGLKEENHVGFDSSIPKRIRRQLNYGKD